MLVGSWYGIERETLEAVKQTGESSEKDAVARFAQQINAMGSLSEASPALQVFVLEQVKRVTRQVNASSEPGAASGYDRRVLHEEAGNWSLAAIILRPGQEVPVHDHGGWGCAATVQGIERDRRFMHDEEGKLALCTEIDYPPGTGYLFDPVDIHQPFGADPQQVTVSLHFLVHPDYRGHHGESFASPLESSASHSESSASPIEGSPSLR